MAINENPGPDGGIETPETGTDGHAGEPDPRGGGCMRLGWGCLPVVGGLMLIPPLFF